MTKGPAICPYCGVGGRLWMESADGKLLHVKGDQRTPGQVELQQQRLLSH
jgi:predicted molibdopterin-dependent oxidoreductase YjgC